MTVKKTNDSIQSELDFDNPIQELRIWPLHEVFPLNLRKYNRRIRTIIEEDIQESKQYTILTGFTSLSNLVEFFGTDKYSHLKSVRIVLGFEPHLRKRKNYPLANLPIEIREFWLRKGLSVLQGSSVINLINKINEQQVDFRFFDRLHAKIYVGDRHAILGSANFSKNGLEVQQEANIRVAQKGRGKRETQHYQDISLIAQNYFEEATPYSDIVDLLGQLVGKVKWQEALARALTEVLEADWLKDYGHLYKKICETQLWPSQRIGVARSMYVLQRLNNVLIADPTGSGKTKTCGVIQMMLMHWLWEHGKQFQANSLVISPPQVMRNWRQEFQDLNFINHAQISQGILSQGGLLQKEMAEKDLSISNIITLDEAHNYLNPASGRSTAIGHSRADYKILATATPINKRANDLLRMIELLDIDNLSDEQLKIYNDLKRRRNHAVSSPELDRLQSFISQFLVRRTKSEISRMIKSNPEAYVNRLGKKCKYPHQNCRTYPVLPLDKDKLIARQIHKKVSKLRGILYLQNISRPPEEMTEEKYIDLRIRAAKALSSYMIRSRLRSSHVALVEHLGGSSIVEQYFGLKSKKEKSGNIILKVTDSANRLPRIKISKNKLPKWLIDANEYKAVCEEEVQVMNEILKLAVQLSGAREMAKAQHLLSTIESNDLVIAFDSIVITLHYLEHLIKTKMFDGTIYMVTGGNQVKKERLLKDFSLESEKKNIIALCSDSMSEGVNLQKASAITLLDMPSVLRIAEQRIGRLDRLDSPHEGIDVWWPDDADEFILKGDERLVQISKVAEHLIGSNLELPKELLEKLGEHSLGTKSSKDVIRMYESSVESDNSWEGFQDAFLPLIRLKEGDNPLIEEKIYNDMLGVQSSIKTRVSFIQNNSNWAFFALRGSKHQSPQWVFIDERDRISSDFPEICELLRTHLDGVNETDWNQDELERFVKRLRKGEIELLPPKRRRALDVANHLLKKRLPKCQSKEEKEIITNTLSLSAQDSIEGHIVDFYQLSQLWLDIFQPELNLRREKSSNKRTTIGLNNLKSHKNPFQLTIEHLNYILDNCSYTEDIDNKIAACIIGTST